MRIVLLKVGRSQNKKQKNTNEWCYPKQLYRLGMLMF